MATYIESKNNVEADLESRSTHIETEYSSNDTAFEKITSAIGIPEIDLFASKINAKVSRYVSWKRDSDSFTITWSNTYFYAFPPFPLVAKVLNKIITEKAEGVVVVPYWEAQP